VYQKGAHPVFLLTGVYQKGAHPVFLLTGVYQKGAHPAYLLAGVQFSKGRTLPSDKQRCFKPGRHKRKNSMKLITRDTDYALRALSCIAKEKDKIVPVSTLVKALKIPKPFLRKILQELSSNGILRSHKGMGGGFSLARPAGKIYLLDVMRIFQGRFQLNECLFKKRICPNVKDCPLRLKMDKIELHVIKELRPVTIASLLR
jgi:Rrf2 family protein